jgi:hypothetical protein
VFYRQVAEGDGGQHYVRSAEQRQLLMMYTLVVSLIVEGYTLGPRQFEALRSELKVPHDQLALFYRCGTVVI